MPDMKIKLGVSNGISVGKLGVTLFSGAAAPTYSISGAVYGCDNILTANTIIASGTSLTYVGCLNMLDYNLDIQGSGRLIIS